MKRFIFILVLAMLSFSTSAWSQESDCPAPTPYVTASSATSCSLAWDNVASLYIVEVYKAGSSNVLQTLQTSETSITINNLDPNLSYEAVVTSICGNEKSQSIRISLLPIIIQDEIMIKIWLEPGTVIKTACTTVLNETCSLKKSRQMVDLMRYGGNVFTVRTPSGYLQEWICEIINNELSFKNSTRSSGIVISTISDPSNPNYIVGIAFKDSQGTLLWTLTEARNAANQVTFNLEFETAACLKIENCVTTITYPTTVCEKDPKYCEDGKANLRGNSNRRTAFTISPNPIMDVAILTLHLKEQEAIDIAVYDMTGKRIQTLQQSNLGRGTHHFTWESAAIPRGIYFVEVKTPTQHLIKKIIKL